MSDGASCSSRPAFEPDAKYTAKMTDQSGKLLLQIDGVLRHMSSDETEFAGFVCERPHKFLYQRQGQNLVTTYAPEDDGSGSAKFSAAGCMGVEFDTNSLVVQPLLERLLGSERSKALDLEHTVAFVQPEYILVDHHNTALCSTVARGVQTTKVKTAS